MITPADGKTRFSCLLLCRLLLLLLLLLLLNRVVARNLLLVGARRSGRGLGRRAARRLPFRSGSRSRGSTLCRRGRCCTGRTGARSRIFLRHSGVGLGVEGGVVGHWTDRDLRRQCAALRRSGYADGNRGSQEVIAGSPDLAAVRTSGPRFRNPAPGWSCPPFRRFSSSYFMRL